MDFSDPALWVSVGFILLVVAAFKPGKKAILGALDGRTERIRHNLDEAANLREEAQQLLSENQRKQRGAIEETEGMIAQARAEAGRLAKEGAEKLSETLKRREQLASEKIKQAEADALREVRLLSVEIAMTATRALIAERMDDKRSESLINDAISNISQKLN
ncbi:MAG: F0F1 ATP synthase subunit B [Pseudomonadota bacterium]|nr:F0F1 ATP synthase subunit B [Pseudomonadota bacterium]